MIGGALGSYQIVKYLGAGGMGTVLLGQHTLIGRMAAIKVLNPEYSHNEVLVGRFFKEAKAASAVRHPGIVEVQDFGYERGQAYIVMEYLEGESLKSRLRRQGLLPETEVLNYARQMGSALSAAHAVGIVHRDLKPENLYIVTDPEMPGGERIKILDFGIAKWPDKGAPPAFKTRDGLALGTPEYMSPEQCRGAGPVDHRADLYAIGCIMFELLTGSPPFVAEGDGEVLAQHLYRKTPTLSSRGAAIGGETERIILKLLAKEPAHRFEDASELVKAIDESWGTARRAPTQPEREVGDGDWGSEDTDAETAALRLPEPTAAASTPPGATRDRTAGSARVRIGLALAGLLVIGVVWGALTITSTSLSPTAPRSTLPSTSASSPDPVSPSPARASSENPSPTARMVRVELVSTPPGAEVYRMPDGARVGRTPYEVETEAVSGERVFLLRARGYRDERVAFPADAGGRREVAMVGRPRRTAKARSTQPSRLKASKTLNPFDK